MDLEHLWSKKIISSEQYSRRLVRLGVFSQKCHLYHVFFLGNELYFDRATSSFTTMTAFKWKCQTMNNCNTFFFKCSLILSLYNLVTCFKFLLKIPYYTSSLCYQYPPSVSPGHYYSEEEQRGISPPLEVSEGEDEFEGHNHSFRKDTSEYFKCRFSTKNESQCRKNHIATWKNW